MRKSYQANERKSKGFRGCHGASKRKPDRCVWGLVSAHSVFRLIKMENSPLGLFQLDDGKCLIFSKLNFPYISAVSSSEQVCGWTLYRVFN